MLENVRARAIGWEVDSGLPIRVSAHVILCRIPYMSWGISAKRKFLLIYREKFVNICASGFGSGNESYCGFGFCLWR